MLTTTTYALARQRRRFERIRYQLGGGILVGAVLPYLFLIAQGESWASGGMIASAIASVAAILIGAYAIRSFANHPGAKSSIVALPCMLAGFALAAVALLMLRLDYVRPQLLGGAVLAVIWYVGVLTSAERTKRLRVGVVPFGDAFDLTGIRSVEWRILPDTKSPADDVDVIVADLRYDLDDEWERWLAQRTLEGQLVCHSKQLRESLTGMVKIDHLSENTFGSLMPIAAYVTVKQAIDIITAAIALPFLLLLLAILYPLVRMESEWPLIFRQQRIGYRGRPFTVFKVRTMRKAAPTGQTCERQASMTADNDPRITRLGRFLRRTRIDELPQIFNVLRCEMSWIGPRPEATSLSRWYEDELPFYSYRHVVRPGITGWAQVNQGHVTAVHEVDEKLQNDFYYIKYFSPWLDALIVIRTIQILLSGFGAR